MLYVHVSFTTWLLALSIHTHIKIHNYDGISFITHLILQKKFTSLLCLCFFIYFIIFISLLLSPIIKQQVLLLYIFLILILCQYTYYIHNISLSLSLYFNTVIQIRTQLSENGMASPIFATNCLYSLCCNNNKKRS